MATIKHIAVEQYIGYRLHCTNCNCTLEAEGYEPVFDTVERAVEEAESYEWLVVFTTKKRPETITSGHMKTVLCETCK